MVIKSEMDIVKTIEDDEEVENLSEDSDVEVEVSRTRKINVLKFTSFLHVFLPFSINQQNKSARSNPTLKVDFNLFLRYLSTTRTPGTI